jgi:hypothetical protein
MPDGTEHKLDYDPSKPEDVAEADRVLGALVRGENVSGSEFDNLQRTLQPSHKPSRVRGNTPVISAAFKAFCAEKRSAGAWKDAEHSERYDYGPIVAELIAVAGDRSIGSLAIDHLRHFIERVEHPKSSKPRNARSVHHGAVARNRPCGLGHATCVSTTTYLERVSNFLTLCATDKLLTLPSI